MEHITFSSIFIGLVCVFIINSMIHSLFGIDIIGTIRDKFFKSSGGDEDYE